MQRIRSLRNAIWVHRGTGERLRKTFQTFCTRLISEGKVTEHHTICTKLGKVRRSDVEDGGRTTYSRAIGKFRTVIRMTRGPVGRSEDDETQEENIVYRDVHLDLDKTRTRRGRGNYGKRRAGIGKKRQSRRTRKRRIVDLSQFTMFHANDGSGVQSKTEMVQDVIGRRGERGMVGINQDSGLSEREKFSTSLDLALSCTDFLYNVWSDVPFIRSCGGRRMRQKYVCVSTLRLKRILRNERVVISVMVNLIIEEESRKLRNICIRREVLEGRTEGGEVNATIAVDEPSFKYLCSCHANWGDGGLQDSCCWHVEMIKGKREMMNRIRSMLVCGLQADHAMYFGRTICFREVEEAGSVNLLLDSIGGVEEVDLEADDGLIAIQMDNFSNDDLLKRGSSVSKKWSSWVVVDAMERTLVSVTWRPVSSGVAETRMTCVMCRSDVLRRCRHERACEKESEIERGNCSDGDGMEGDENGERSGSEYGSDVVDVEARTMDKEMDEWEVAEPAVMEPDVHDGKTVGDMNDWTGRAVNEQKTCF